MAIFTSPATLRRMTENADELERRAGSDEVARLVKASGRDQGQVADYLSRATGRAIKNYHVSRMITGQRKVAHDEMDALRALAEHPASAPPAVPPLVETSDVVPLFGFANGAGSIIRLNENERLGVVPIHPAQRNSRGGYAFVTFGDSVSPRLQHGETGYAVRNLSPQKDQLCVVLKTDGETLVKFYSHHDDRTLTVYETNPKRREIAIPFRDVLRWDAVVGATFGRG